MPLRPRTTARGWLAFGLASAAVLYSFLFSGAIFYLADDARIAALSGLALPAAALLAWLLLHLRCKGRRAPGDVAWALVIGLLFFSFISGFSIGLYVFPAALLLAASAFLVDVSDP
jgi:hypothetical protein